MGNSSWFTHLVNGDVGFATSLPDSKDHTETPGCSVASELVAFLVSVTTPDKELVEGRYVHFGSWFGGIQSIPVGRAWCWVPLWLWELLVHISGPENRDGRGREASCKPEVLPTPRTQFLQQDPTPKGYPPKQHYTTRLSVQTHKPLGELYI